MRYPRRPMVIASVLGALALVMVVLSTLALLDIAQAKEADLLAEWAIVWLGLIVVAIAQVAWFIAAFQGRRAGDPREESGGA